MKIKLNKLRTPKILKNIHENQTTLPKKFDISNYNYVKS